MPISRRKTAGATLRRDEVSASLNTANVQDDSLPHVSVVMAVRNEAVHIAQTVLAVLRQDYPHDRMEVIIADGMSTDGTRQIVQNLQGENTQLRLISNPGRIVASGLNSCIREANGDTIVRVDGHTEIAPSYVRQCVTSLLRTGADNVGGKMTAVGTNFVGRAIVIATSTPLGVGGARFHYSDCEEWVDTVYLGAWRKSVFVKLGLFDEEQVRNQDDEFNYRLLKHGGRILITPAVKSTYTVRNSLRRLWAQYFQYGFWKVRVMQKHPREMRWRQFAPLSLVVALILAAAAAPWTTTGRIALSLVLGTYVIALLAGTFWTARKAGWRYMVLLPTVFATLHLSYGFGFLKGLFVFGGRWGDRAGKVPSLEVISPEANG